MVVDSLNNDLAADGIDVAPFLRPLPSGNLDPTFAADWIGQVQDDVIEATSAAWPSCPAHSHPMTLELEGEWFAWCCPETGKQVAEYGGLVDIR